MPEDVVYLTVDDLLLVAAAATEVTDDGVAVRDHGLLDAAANRPRATAFGQDAYPTVHEKAAALLQSIARNHALVDGNKRTAWLATYVFYDLNGYELDAPDDDGPVALVLDLIADHLDVEDIAARLSEWLKPR
jgi:death-on-curing protein